MRNFRKVLALVLVVATLLSFATMASADYKDQADIATKYEVAVDVLTGIGILNGEKKGDDVVFRPTDEIDRDEVAKMVAVLANGGADIEKYYADACAFADVKNTWAAGYVAYCYHTGIVDGRNATTFDPDASITGYEVAKMLLCVMGFDADKQGYVGKDWKVNVLRDAKNFGLLAGLDKDFNLKDNIKRQEVAQMMYTMLSRPVVLGTISNNIVDITNSYWVAISNGKITSDKVYITDMKANTAVLYGNVVVAVEDLVGEMFGISNYVVYDNVGRPYLRWFSSWNKWYKDYAYAPASTSNKGIAKLNANIAFVDGNLLPAGSEVYGKDYAGYANKNGLVVETYAIKGDKTVAVILYTDLAQVSGAEKYQGQKIFDLTYLSPLSHTSVTKDNLANTAGYANGDKILVTYCNAEYTGHLALAADVVNGKDPLGVDNWVEKEGYKAKAILNKVDAVQVKVTDVVSTSVFTPDSWTRANSNFYSDSTKYEYHHNILGDACIKTANIGKTYNVIFDKGYAMYWSEVTPADSTTYDYAVFHNAYKQIANNTYVNGVKQPDTFYLNDLIDFTAAENDEVLTVESVTTNVAKHVGAKGRLVKYAVKDGKIIDFELSQVADQADVDLEFGELHVNGADIQLTNTTKFLVKVNGEFKAYTGYKAVAEVYGKKVLNSDFTQRAQYFASGIEATYVYLQIDKAVENGFFFLVEKLATRASVQLASGGQKVVDKWNAIVNGEEVQLWINSDNYESNKQPLNLVNALYNVKDVYLNMVIDGQKIYYVDDSMDVQLAEKIALTKISDGKLYYVDSDNATKAVHLADSYTIYVIDYAWNKDHNARPFSGVTTFTDADSFNAEFQGNNGYEFEAYAVVNTGYISQIFVVRTTK